MENSKVKEESVQKYSLSHPLHFHHLGSICFHQRYSLEVLARSREGEVKSGSMWKGLCNE